MSLYPFVDRHIYKAPGDPKWKFSRVRLFTGMIDGAISLASDTFYGAYFGPKTQHAVLDIDEESRYHTDQELIRLRKVFATVELRLVRYQSSKGGGWHLYLFFDDWQDSSEVAAALKAFLQANRFEIKQGQLEIFPSDTQALRLPLQPGFAWLDQSVSREELTTEQAVDLFLNDWQENACNWGLAKSLIESQLEAAATSAGELPPAHAQAISSAGFDDLFSSRIIQENYNKGRKYWQEGLTGQNQRHDAIICVEHYLWHGDTDAGLPAYPGRFNDKRRYELIRAWLEANHNGYCKHIAAGDWKTVEADIWRAVLWRRDSARAPEYEPYKLTEAAQEVLIARSMRTGRAWTMEDLEKGNNRRERSARSKIRRALNAMLATGQQITRNALARKAGCSPNTVSRHRDIWSLFAGGSGDKSRGVQGGLSVLSAASGSEKDFLNPLLEADSGDLKLDRQEELSVQFEPVVNSEETTKTQASAEFSALSIEKIAVGHAESNGENIQDLSVFKERKTLFILPYGALAASNGSASVPLRQLAGREVLAGAQEGLNESRRHDSTPGTENAAYRTSQKAQKKDRLTYLSAALPENHAAGEPVSMTGAASVYRLVIDTGGK